MVGQGIGGSARKNRNLIKFIRRFCNHVAHDYHFTGSYLEGSDTQNGKGDVVVIQEKKDV